MELIQGVYRQIVGSRSAVTQNVYVHGREEQKSANGVRRASTLSFGIPSEQSAAILRVCPTRVGKSVYPVSIWQVQFFIAEIREQIQQTLLS
jgi:hypothetical protein